MAVVAIATTHHHPTVRVKEARVGDGQLLPTQWLVLVATAGPWPLPPSATSQPSLPSLLAI